MYRYVRPFRFGLQCTSPPNSPVPQLDRAHNVRSFLIISSDAGAINRIPQFIRILTTTSEGFWIIYATFCYTYTHLPSRTATGVLKGVAQAYHGFAFALFFPSFSSSVLHCLFAPPKHLSPQALVSFVCVCVCLTWFSALFFSTLARSHPSKQA